MVASTDGLQAMDSCDMSIAISRSLVEMHIVQLVTRSGLQRNDWSLQPASIPTNACAEG